MLSPDVSRPSGPDLPAKPEGAAKGDPDSTRLGALVEAGIALASEQHLDDLLFRIADQARRVVGAGYAAVGVVGTDGSLTNFVYSGIDEETARLIGALPTGGGVLGVVLEQAHPLRLKDIARHPRSAGFPPHHPVMHSFLGAPIMAHGVVFGRLYLSEKVGAQEFSLEDERIAMMFAAQAGVAIENVSLYEEVEARGEELARRLSQLASIELVARMLISESSSDDVLRSAVEQASLLTGGTRATLMLRDDATDEMVIRTASGGGSGIEGIRLAPGTSKSQAVLVRKEPESVADLDADPEINAQVRELFGNPSNGAFAPLLLREEGVGTLAVYGSADGRPFTADDLAVLQILANHAAIALENDRLTQLLRSLAILEERERISKELHDGVIQAIYSVGLSLQGSLSLLRGHPDRAAQRIEEAIVELDTVVRDVRNYIFELRPHLVQERGFDAAILELVRELEVNTTAAATVELAGDAARALGTQSQSHIVQIVREILSNIARHAHATQIRVVTDLRDGAFVLTVDDNGIGFDPSTVQGGHGLRNMSARTAAIGGELAIGTAPGGGTRHQVTVALPGTA